MSNSICICIFKCHLWGNKCDNRYELKKHLIIHSYKKVKYKFSECNFVCQYEVSMEVHIVKQHSDKYEGGFCDLEAGNFENLELHLTTCEMYRCDQKKLTKDRYNAIAKLP